MVENNLLSAAIAFHKLSCPMTMTPPHTLRIAVLGTGMMGLPMAKRLHLAGHKVHVWNRTAAKTSPLQALGCQVHTTPANAAMSADVIISLLENGNVVEQVLFNMGTAQAMREGSLFIDMASIQPQEARHHAARLGELGINYLDAPVSGGTVGAETGELAILVGGQSTDFVRAQPIFKVLGRATHVGPNGAGQLTKLANQMIVGATIGAVAEALLFAAKGGADMAKVKDAITGGFADSRILQLHGQRMIDNDFSPRGRMGVQLKDLRNALATAEEIGFTAPITTLFEELYAKGVEHGLGDLDQSGLFVELASRNAMHRQKKMD